MSQADQARIISLRRSGLSVATIASFLGTDLDTVVGAVAGTGDLPASSGGSGLALGAWDVLEEWAEGAVDPLTARWPAVAALTVPSEIIVFGYFDMTGNPAVSSSTLRLYEGEFSTLMENLTGYAEGAEGVDSSFFIRATIAASVAPILATNGVSAENGAVVNLQLAKRRPLA